MSFSAFRGFLLQQCKTSLCIILATSLHIPTVSAEAWRGLVVEPEDRCSPYRSNDYSYPQSVEPKIVVELGKIYSPYTGQCFGSIRQTDIEHIVARSEAHDSGLCRADIATRKRFSSDLLNLTLASPTLNRQQKRAYDAAEWMPKINRCWFANRVLQVRLKYGLSIDRREAEALERILSACTTVEIEKSDCVAVSDLPASRPAASSEEAEALRLWDDNRNGRITCREARRHGIAPVPRGHPAYPFMHDGDGDGVVCE
ncbi:MAG: excalibur calcium-binding domain-containing protein [Gammaproteobacteria bacterium]|nr:excalibur calcium-binding domain-containing protein [Gammaproteobacteria bacterium]